jgi:hypothetical protein
MCRDSLTPNMRKEIKEIVSANMEEEDSTSTNDLLKKLIEITEKQNNLLSASGYESRKTDRLTIATAMIAVLIAVSSFDAAYLKDQPCLLSIGIGLCIFFIFVIIFLFWTLDIRDKEKNRSLKP